MKPREHAANPFCTRRVRPGGIPFIFPPGQNTETLLARLRQTGWHGAIVGPHGSGKSTLLVAVESAMRQDGIAVVHIELHDGQRKLPLDFVAHAPSVDGTTGGRRTVVVVDGYEQLGYLSRIRLWLLCRRRKLGLLVTSHKPVRLPSLWRTAVTPELAHRIVADLLQGHGRLFTPDEVSDCLARHGGDLRETLFDLYDLYQLRWLASGENAT